MRGVRFYNDHGDLTPRLHFENDGLATLMCHFFQLTNYSESEDYPLYRCIPDLKKSGVSLKKIISSNIDCEIDEVSGCCVYLGAESWFVFSRNGRLRIPHPSLEQFFLIYGIEILFLCGDGCIDLVDYVENEYAVGNYHRREKDKIDWRPISFYRIMVKNYGKMFESVFTQSTRDYYNSLPRDYHTTVRYAVNYSSVFFFCSSILYHDKFFTFSRSRNHRYFVPNRQKKIKRFIKIMGKLPFELQHVLCNRASGSSRNFIDQEQVNCCFGLIFKHWK